MEIFNKSKRTFKLSTGDLKPEKSTIVPDAEGTKLIEGYVGEIIQIGNSAAEKENKELKAKIAELENQPQENTNPNTAFIEPKKNNKKHR